MALLVLETLAAFTVCSHFSLCGSNSLALDDSVNSKTHTL